jgi:hypothetical protein
MEILDILLENKFNLIMLAIIGSVFGITKLVIWWRKNKK